MFRNNLQAKLELKCHLKQFIYLHLRGTSVLIKPINMQSLSYTRLVLIIPRIDRQSSCALSVATHLKLKNATRSNTGHTQHVFTATVL